ncbi:hypothetical protein ACWCXH_07780 [Kitasatospora sp. NPDC001660]
MERTEGRHARPLPHRALQLGLSGKAARALLPEELPYPVEDGLLTYLRG